MIHAANRKYCATLILQVPIFQCSVLSETMRCSLDVVTMLGAEFSWCVYFSACKCFADIAVLLVRYILCIFLCFVTRFQYFKEA